MTPAVGIRGFCEFRSKDCSLYLERKPEAGKLVWLRRRGCAAGPSGSMRLCHPRVSILSCLHSGSSPRYLNFWILFSKLPKAQA